MLTFIIKFAIIHISLCLPTVGRRERPYPKGTVVTETDRSPLHPKALNRDDLRPGLQITWFDTETGVMGRFTVMSPVHMGPPYNISTANEVEVVDLMRDYDAQIDIIELAYLGVGRLENGEWHPIHFAVLASDEESLPEPLEEIYPSEPYRNPFMMDEDRYRGR